ncbi:hypothetical protein HMPREF3034_01883 [Prevotella sp. DNF00663]|nr:hypothetical protein HMPREF3034_01883 [Prevotella sp. DNF00663]
MLLYILYFANYTLQTYIFFFEFYALKKKKVCAYTMNFNFVLLVFLLCKILFIFAEKIINI